MAVPLMTRPGPGRAAAAPGHHDHHEERTMDQDRILAAQRAIDRARTGGQVTQLDPYGCGCTECLTGESVPLNQATDEQVLAMILGEIGNATGHELPEFTVRGDGQVIRPVRW
jgi:hypothetical protein